MNDAESAFEFWARSQGWVITKRGWPDFLCRRGAEVAAVEVKDHADWLSPEQRAALIDLHAAGVDTYIWTPTDGMMPYPKKQFDNLASRLEMGAELDRAQTAAKTTSEDRDRFADLWVRCQKDLNAARGAVHKRNRMLNANLRLVLSWCHEQTSIPADVRKAIDELEMRPGLNEGPWVDKSA